MKLNYTSNFKAFWICCMAYTVRLLLAAFYRQTSLIFPVNIPPYQIMLLQMLTESFPRRSEDYRQVQALVLDESSSNNIVKAGGNSPKSS